MTDFQWVSVLFSLTLGSLRVEVPVFGGVAPPFPPYLTPSIGPVGSVNTDRASVVFTPVSDVRRGLSRPLPGRRGGETNVSDFLPLMAQSQGQNKVEQGANLSTHFHPYSSTWGFVCLACRRRLPTFTGRSVVVGTVLLSGKFGVCSRPHPRRTRCLQSSL